MLLDELVSFRCSPDLITAVAPRQVGWFTQRGELSVIHAIPMYPAVAIHGWQDRRTHRHVSFTFLSLVVATTV